MLKCWSFILVALTVCALGLVSCGNPLSAPHAQEVSVQPPVENYSGLFFSDYGEGSSNNKYLEVFNSSASAVSLDAVFMVLLSNNYILQTGSQVHSFPAGTSIPAGSVYGIYNDQAVVAIRIKLPASTSFSSPATYFSGDDDILLVHDVNGNGSYDHGVDTILDIIGYAFERISFGTDKGLRRKSGITTGSTTFDVSQWIEYSQADVDSGDYYGVHP